MEKIQIVQKMAKVLIDYTKKNHITASTAILSDYAEELYEEGYRKREWISVEERLPERPGAYLVFTCDRRISMCHFIDHYCDGDMQFDDYRVTHWMPLPEAPKDDTE